MPGVKGNANGMARGYGDAPRGSSAAGAPRFLLSLIVFANLFLIFVTMYHNTHVRTQWAEIDQELNTTATVGRSLLQKFDDLSTQVHSSLRANLLNTNTPIVASQPGHIVVRAAHRGTRKLCSYSEPELKGILSLRHGCGWGNNRYYYGGVWMDWKMLHKEFEQPRPNAPLGGAGGASEAECVLACKYQADFHCSKEVPCVHAFHLRRKTSDTLVLRQLYEWAEHDFLKPNMPFNAILDAGANIGIASVLFATMFPNALVVSVEASNRNFKVLQKNVAPYPNVIPVNAALWPRVAPLSLIVGPRNLDKPPEWGFMVVETSTLKDKTAVEDSLAGVSAPFLLKVFGVPAFDFVKVDIEGGEGELLAHDTPEETGWVNKAKMIAMELHGDMAPGSNVTVHRFFARRPQFVRYTDARLIEDYCIFKRKDVFPAGPIVTSTGKLTVAGS